MTFPLLVRRHLLRQLDHLKERNRELRQLKERATPQRHGASSCMCALACTLLSLSFFDKVSIRGVSKQCHDWFTFWSLHDKRWEKRWRWARKRRENHMTAMIDQLLPALVIAGVASPTTIHNHESARKINSDLTKGASIGVLVDFSDDDGRAVYTYTKIRTRARIATAVLLMDNPVMGWIRQHLFLKNAKCRAASIGGGPGFDALSLASIKDLFKLTCEMELNNYDYEPAWADTVHALHNSGRVSSCPSTFDTGDIRQGVFTAANAALAASVHHVNLFLFNYVCVENSTSMQQDGHVFLRSVFRSARPGAVMVFTDTTDRLWPQIAALGGGRFLSFLLVLKTSCPKIALIMVKCHDTDTDSDSMQSPLARIALSKEGMAKNALGEMCMFVNGGGADFFFKVASERYKKSLLATDKWSKRAAQEKNPQFGAGSSNGYTV